jgi:hypothetical protein
MFLDMPEAYPKVERLKGASLGEAPALSANIRLGWKSSPVANTSAYYEISEKRSYSLI